MVANFTPRRHADCGSCCTGAPTPYCRKRIQLGANCVPRSYTAPTFRPSHANHKRARTVLIFNGLFESHCRRHFSTLAWWCLAPLLRPHGRQNRWKMLRQPRVPGALRFPKSIFTSVLTKLKKKKNVSYRCHRVMRVAPSSCGFQRGCAFAAAADSLPPPTGRPWVLTSGTLPPSKKRSAWSLPTDC